MTTSFADGRIYESIVDEYEPFLTGNGRGDRGNADGHSASISLESRLHLLGCSYQFGKLYEPTKAFETK
jgi:abnormal spindle-like microcephaly-associated protein